MCCRLSASHDGTVRVWNKRTYKQHGVLGPIGCHVLGVYGDVENAVTLSADRCVVYHCCYENYSETISHYHCRIS